MAVVRACGLVKTFGEGRVARRVLDGADLDVAPGEVVAVLGRSGSGKSTLLHLLGGLDRPDAGSIEVAGVDVARASRARAVGAAPAPRRLRLRLLPELSGEANVLLAGRMRDAQPDAPARGTALIDRLGLRHVAGSLPAQLSGGEQQRFAIARALVNDPALLLADEPTGNLDAEAGAEVLGLLRAGADEGRAVVMVTHEAGATAMAGRDFVKPKPYESIMPEALPARRELVYLSGLAEMAGGAGVLADRTARPAGWWPIATMLAVFPANIDMAVEAERFRGVPEPLLWARLPLQAGIVYWIWRVAVRATSGARRR